MRAHGDEHENYQKCFSARNESLPFEVQGKGDQIICCNTKNEDIWEKLGGLSTFRKNLFQTNLEKKKQPSTTVVPEEIHTGYLP